MSELPIYRVGVKPARRKEWVVLPEAQARVCVWSMTVAESAQLMDRCTRPDGKPSTGKVVVLQIMLSCYNGDDDKATHIFSATDEGAVYDLPLHDMEAIIAAINRVNGKDATEQELLRDFTIAREGHTASP